MPGRAISSSNCITFALLLGSPIGYIMFELFHISYHALIVALFLMAIVFLFIPLPKTDEIRNYRISLKVLSFAYITLALYCVFKSHYPIQLIGVPFLVASTLQAHCLSITHFNLVSPQSITKKFLIKRLYPFFLLCGIYLLSRAVEPHVRITDYASLWLQTTADGDHQACWYSGGTIHWEVLVRIIWLVYYIYLIISCSVLFFQKERICRENLQEFTADYPFTNLTIIRISFLLVILVAINSVLIALCLNQNLCTLLNFGMLMLYGIIGILYLQYPKVYFNIYNSNTEGIQTPVVPTENNGTWSNWKKKIIDSEVYLASGITIQQVCTELCTNRSTLSSLINKEEGCNFNTFINRLRIEKAKTLMKESNLSLLDICLTVGYSDQGNFSRHFKEVTGVSPSEWKRKH